jgi:hypothetical protein
MTNDLSTVKVWHLWPAYFNGRESLSAPLECCGKPFDHVWALARFAPTKVGFTTEQPTCTKGQA